MLILNNQGCTSEVCVSKSFFKVHDNVKECKLFYLTCEQSDDISKFQYVFLEIRLPAARKWKRAK